MCDRDGERPGGEGGVCCCDVLAAAALGVVAVDADGRIVFSNELAERLFGYGKEELAALPLEALVPERHRAAHAAHREALGRAPAVPPMARAHDVVGRRKDGSELRLEIALGAVESGGQPRFVALIRDATERYAAEQAARAYQARLQGMAFEAAVTNEEERRRLAVALHDRIGQSLALARMRLAGARDEAEGGTRSELGHALDLLEQCTADVRALMFELSPPVLYDLGLEEALSWLAEDLERRHGIRIDVRCDALAASLAPAMAVLLFRSVRELLTNVLEHAHTSAARVTLRRAGAHLLVEVTDDGIGFVPAEVTSGTTAKGFGLFGVREHIGRLGGTLEIESAPQSGTRVRLQVPLAAEAEAAD
ncbi:MAG: PAS domain-containing sensor histidine kinase [Myxococcales bacterium]|nr:PAS domain-containing sensor histidine kinase [Myxococcales bacterium]